MRKGRSDELVQEELLQDIKDIPNSFELNRINDVVRRVKKVSKFRLIV